MTETVAALYVDPNGVYAGLPDVDLWDEERDARSYDGPWPVVAHPPCNRWCQVAYLNQSLHGYQVGDDGGCFSAALASVRKWGGVLEHPALSYAWAAFQLPVPTRGGWTRSFLDEGWTTEISQVAYGHQCRKRTWLYYFGAANPPAMNWREPAATHQVTAFRLAEGGRRYSQALDKGKSSYTPEGLRDTLIHMARLSAQVTA